MSATRDSRRRVSRRAQHVRLWEITPVIHRWYCSEPRLGLNRIVVTRYRMQLEQLHLAPSTINQRLAAVRRLAYEASDAGLLSPELAAGIKRYLGSKQEIKDAVNDHIGVEPAE